MIQEIRIVTCDWRFEALQIWYLVKLPLALLMATNGMNLELHEMIFQEDLFLKKEKSGFVEHKNLQLVPVVLDNLHSLGKLYDKVRADTSPNT